MDNKTFNDFSFSDLVLNKEDVSQGTTSIVLQTRVLLGYKVLTQMSNCVVMSSVNN